jgi:hypothetical protein
MHEMRMRLVRVLALAACVAMGARCVAEEIAAANPVVPESPVSPDSLQALEWLLGEWTGMTDNAAVLVSARWCEGGAFIERELVVRREGQEDIGGTQRIGWDPLAGKIKCWSFDSLGGFGEGYWRQDGEKWVVESQDVLADGSQSTTKTVYTPRDADRFLWEVASSQVDGMSLPKQQIEFVRAAKE